MKKENNKGILLTHDLQENRIYTLFTKEGEWRWGSSYSEEKTFVLLTWRVKITLDLWDRDESLEILPGELIHVEPWIPHVFYFPEDTEMLERFPKDAVVTKDERLTAMKSGEAPEVTAGEEIWTSE